MYKYVCSVRMCIWFRFLFPISTFAISFSLRFHPFYCLSTTHAYVTQSSGKIVCNEQFNFQHKCFFRKTRIKKLSRLQVSSTFFCGQVHFPLRFVQEQSKSVKRKSQCSLPSLSRQSLCWSKIRIWKANQLGKQEIDVYKRKPSHFYRINLTFL